MDNGNESAFPGRAAMQWGLTKREYFAAMAMQGLICSDPRQQIAPDLLSSWAVQSADALLAELAKDTSHD